VYGRSDLALAEAREKAAALRKLAPIWTDKPKMARKVRSRIGQVLAYAKA
jgi:hypothetical protein